MSSLYIVKAKKTFLKSPLSTTAMQVILDELVDSKGNDIALPIVRNQYKLTFCYWYFKISFPSSFWIWMFVHSRVFDFDLHIHFVLNVKLYCNCPLGTILNRVYKLVGLKNSIFFFSLKQIALGTFVLCVATLTKARCTLSHRNSTKSNKALFNPLPIVIIEI